MSDSEKFAQAAARLNSAFAAHDDAAVSPDDDRFVRDTLERILFIRYGKTLGADEILDVVSETVTELFRQSRRRGIPFENAAGWLVRVAGNEAKDRISAFNRFADVDDEGVEDDQSATVINRFGSQSSVARALELAIDDRDQTTVRIVTDWLDLEETLGRSPSSRKVAEKSGFSHTTVNEALSRFGEYLREVGESGELAG